MEFVGPVLDTSEIQPWIAELQQPVRLSTILIVDDDEDHVGALRALLETDGARVLVARGVGEAREILGRVRVELVVIEAGSPDLDGVNFCNAIRVDRRTELTPVLMLSRVPAVEQEIACLGSGADGYLGRPCHPEALRARVRSLLRRKTAVDRLEDSEAILLGLSQAFEQRDHNTAGHCDRLATLCVAMGIVMDLPFDHLQALHRGGYLHDIGKIGMPDSLLFKRGPLDELEWRIMRTHTVKGETICRPMKCLAPVLPIIRSHHERWNGTGYPDGIAGENIPLLARVLQFADIYDALTSERPYKDAMSSTDALQVIRDETSRGWHDPELMRLFLQLRHENLQEAANRNVEEWQDLRVMKESLENLRCSILRA
jgi:putative two-component system response regulator